MQLCIINASICGVDANKKCEIASHYAYEMELNMKIEKYKGL